MIIIYIFEGVFELVCASSTQILCGVANIFGLIVGDARARASEHKMWVKDKCTHTHTHTLISMYTFLGHDARGAGLGVEHHPSSYTFGHKKVQSHTKCVE